MTFRMLDVNKMCTMTSKFNILHFKGTMIFTHFYEKVSGTVSKFNAYFPHITGCFHLQIHAIFSMTDVNVMSR